MDLPSLNALRAFSAVARLGSMTAAATELRVTSSAVSRQISNLEEGLGIALLIRDGRGVRLSADGERLEAGLADAFGQIDAAVDRLRVSMHGNRLRILVPTLFASLWLVPRFDRFKAMSPETEVVFSDASEFIDAPNNADLAISWGRFEDSATTVAEPLTESEEIFPVCREDVWPEQRHNGVALLDCEFIGPEGWRWPNWPEWFAAVGLERQADTYVARMTPRLLLDAVRQAKGVMLACTTIAHDEVAAGRLVRPVRESMPVGESYWLLTSRAGISRPEVAAFRNWLKDEIAACFDFCDRRK